MSDQPMSGSEAAAHYGRLQLERAEQVNHPQHYGGDTPHEVIKCLEAWELTNDAYLFNVVKYLARAGKKGPALQDLKKAKFYLDRKIANMEAENGSSS